MLRTVEITRSITPLREGSSLPALVEADDGAEYVIDLDTIRAQRARCTRIQPGPLHAGVTDDSEATFEQLCGVLVRR